MEYSINLAFGPSRMFMSLDENDIRFTPKVYMNLYGEQMPKWVYSFDALLHLRELIKEEMEERGIQDEDISVWFGVPVRQFKFVFKGDSHLYYDQKYDFWYGWASDYFRKSMNLCIMS